jgi:hypothetical protein
MSTLLPMTHDCCWARSGRCTGSVANGLLPGMRRGATTVWYALLCWQVERLKRRIAAFEPNCRLLP